MLYSLEDFEVREQKKRLEEEQSRRFSRNLKLFMTISSVISFIVFAKIL